MISCNNGKTLSPMHRLRHSNNSVLKMIGSRLNCPIQTRWVKFVMGIVWKIYIHSYFPLANEYCLVSFFYNLFDIDVFFTVVICILYGEWICIVSATGILNFSSVIIWQREARGGRRTWTCPILQHRASG